MDKLQHLATGAAIALIARVAGIGPPEALALAVLAGILKEAYDATGRGTPDPLDFLATALGGFVAFV